VNKIVIAVIGLVLLSGCSFVAPDISKAQSEQRQLKESETQTKLLDAQLVQLTRIANALEKAIK
jgi:uncharacterized protein YceK